MEIACFSFYKICFFSHDLNLSTHNKKHKMTKLNISQFNDDKYNFYDTELYDNENIKNLEQSIRALLTEDLTA